MHGVATLAAPAAVVMSVAVTSLVDAASTSAGFSTIYLLGVGGSYTGETLVAIIVLTAASGLWLLWRALKTPRPRTAKSHL